MKRYEARYDGQVWSAGRMVEVGDVIGTFDSRGEAEAACRDYELNDFDRDHIRTFVEVVEVDERKYFVANDGGEVSCHDCDLATATANIEEMERLHPGEGWEILEDGGDE